jgi:hypothetical protein
MLFSSSYSPFIGVFVVMIVVFIVAYCVRINRAQRQIAPNPMQVVVLARPHQHPSQYPQMCWTVPIIEQPPPPYNTVITTTTNPNITHVNNES